MIAVRPARAADAGAIAAIYAPYVLEGTVSFEVTAPDAAAMAARMAAAGDRYPWLVAERDGEVVGYAHASQFSSREAYRWAVETTIYVEQGGTRSGVGQRLYGALLSTLGAQGFAQAIGRISLPNYPSIQLHERLGFREAGVLSEIGWKDGRWIDVAYWQCALGGAGGAPEEPRAVAARMQPA